MRLIRGVLAGAVVAILMSLALPATGLAQKPKPAKKPQLAGLYNTRYCEIFVVTAPEPPAFQVDIFNTVGLNNCPAALWDAVDFTAIKEERGALAAVPNGPRRWVIDSISGATAGPPTELSGLGVRFVAALETDSLTPPPFTVLKIDRTTEWNYRKGRTIRQVIAPNGTRYAMQAYSLESSPRLTERQLNQIGRNPAVALPKGWKFKTRKLKRKLTLRSVGSTRIVRDGVGSVYQRFKWPKQKSKRKRDTARHQNRAQVSEKAGALETAGPGEAVEIAVLGGPERSLVMLAGVAEEGSLQAFQW